MTLRSFSCVVVLGLLAVGGCKSGSGGGGGTTTTSSALSYVATSGEGDLAVWVVADGGADISVTLTKVDDYGNAVDGGTHVFTGTCSARNATFDYRTCTLTGVTPAIADGGSPKTGDQFYTLELPGVAYLAHPAGSGSGGARRRDLHVGVIAGACANFTGTYNSVHVGAPGSGWSTFGQFSLTGANDGTISSILSYDYGLVVNGAYSMASSNDPVRPALTGQEITYTAADGGSTCANGVATFDFAIMGFATIRIRTRVTAAGTLLVDLPRGLGGLVGVSTAGAATLDDLRNRTLTILTYEGGGDDPSLELMNIRIDDAGTTWLTARTRDAGIENDGGVGRMAPLSESSLATWFGSSAWVDGMNYTTQTIDGGTVATWEPADGGIRAAAPAPASLSGFFTIVDSQGRPFVNDGTTIIMLAQKVDGGVFVAGGHLAVNNYRHVDNDGGYTQCFARPRPDGTPNGRMNNRQMYCIDAPFVGYSR